MIIGIEIEIMIGCGMCYEDFILCLLVCSGVEVFWGSRLGGGWWDFHIDIVCCPVIWYVRYGFM